MKKHTRKAITLLIAMIVVMGTTILFAPESKAIVTYTISFETNGGTPIESFETGAGNAPEQPDKPTKDGYIFENWYSDEELTVPFIFGTTPVTGNTTIYVKWTKLLTGLNATVTLPEVGTEVTVVDYEQTPRVTATCTSDECEVAAIGIVTEPNSEDFFSGTIEDGKDYYVELYFQAKDMDQNKYAFTKDSTFSVNGSDDYVRGTYYATLEGPSSGFLIFAKVTAGSKKEEEKAEPAEYTVVEGDDQTVNIVDGGELTVRFSIPYDVFTASGAVYVDGTELEDTKYTSKEGSTIITLNEDYVKTLEVGEHTLKVAVADGEVSATFNIKEETKSIKAGDSIAMYVSLLAIAMFGAVCLIIKKSYKV